MNLQEFIHHTEGALDLFVVPPLMVYWARKVDVNYFRYGLYGLAGVALMRGLRYVKLAKIKRTERQVDYEQNHLRK